MPTTPTTPLMYAHEVNPPTGRQTPGRRATGRPATGHQLAGRRLPGPRPTSRWRWARAPRSMLGGGLLAAVLALGTGVGAAAAATTSSNSGSMPGPGSGGTKPAAMGTITALGTGSITIKTRQGASDVVTYTSSTTLTALGSSGTATLKVGEMVAVQGTTSGNTVTATSIQILPKRSGKGRPPAAGKGGNPPTGATPPAGSKRGQAPSGGTPPAA